MPIIEETPNSPGKLFSSCRIVICQSKLLLFPCSDSFLLGNWQDFTSCSVHGDEISLTNPSKSKYSRKTILCDLIGTYLRSKNISWCWTKWNPKHNVWICVEGVLERWHVHKRMCTYQVLYPNCSGRHNYPGTYVDVEWDGMATGHDLCPSLHKAHPPFILNLSCRCSCLILCRESPVMNT